MQKPSQDIFVVHHAPTFGTIPRHHARTDYECYLFFLCLRHVCRCSSIATVWVRQGRRWGHSRANFDHLQVFSGLSLRLHLAVTVNPRCWLPKPHTGPSSLTKDSKSRKLVFDGIDAASKCYLTQTGQHHNLRLKASMIQQGAKREIRTISMNIRESPLFNPNWSPKAFCYLQDGPLLFPTVLYKGDGVDVDKRMLDGRKAAVCSLRALRFPMMSSLVAIGHLVFQSWHSLDFLIWPLVALEANRGFTISTGTSADPDFSSLAAESRGVWFPAQLKDVVRLYRRHHCITQEAMIGFKQVP